MGQMRKAAVSRLALLTSVASIALGSQPASAAETITYTYDVHGRVTGVSHSGSVNNGLNVTYSYDAADNRTNVTTTGSPH